MGYTKEDADPLTTHRSSSGGINYGDARCVARVRAIRGQGPDRLLRSAWRKP
jgi:hypothetical protein